MNHHTAGSWKDYFLENCDRLSHRIFMTTPDTEDVEHRALSPARGRTILRHGNSANTSRTASRTRPSSRSKPASSNHSRQSRGRTHSRTRQRVRFSETPSPSRPPTPPPAPPAPSGNRKFSEAETEYFFKSVKWQLSKDPYRSYLAMARVLADNVSLLFVF